MKPIVIRRFCQPSVPILLLQLLSIAIPLWLLFAGVAQHNVSMIVIGTLLLSFFLLALGVFWCYGIKITKKYVTVLYYDTFQVFRLEDIVRMEIGFDSESIWGEIKAKDEPLFDFYFDEFNLAPSTWWFQSLWTVKVKLTQRYVDNMVTALSSCKKIRVINRYKNES